MRCYNGVFPVLAWAVVMIQLLCSPTVVQASATNTSGASRLDDEDKNKSSKSLSFPSASSSSLSSSRRSVHAARIRPEKDDTYVTAAATTRSSSISSSIPKPSLASPSVSRKDSATSAESMSERLDSLLVDASSRNDDFRERLLAQEQQQQQQASSHHNTSAAAVISSSSAKKSGSEFNLLWHSATASIVLLVASSLLTLSSSSWLSSSSSSLMSVHQSASGAPQAVPQLALLWKDLSAVLTSVWSVLWIPILWIRPNHVIPDLLNYVHLMLVNRHHWKQQLFTNNNKNVVSFAARTVRKMVVAELWSRFWSAVFKSGSKWLSLSVTTTTTSQKEASTNNNNDSSSTLLSVRRARATAGLANSLLVTSIRKGIRNLIKKCLQTHLQASMITVGGVLLNAVVRRHDSNPTTNQQQQAAAVAE